ncbi:MAG: hypothetical protein A3I05_02345 [Deltaproteobacteria bacterium RIFCSPLOWO2_02_FULL_44_10]|nr:MAG: hypothetical protein A3I05_02345 [Deltaproteobacteria bacterium RIFCSPLOWO2_02_FULL_44_10]
MNEQTKSQTAVGQYYLMEKIAQGGMAEIFKGLSYDVHGLKRTVCIKKILPHIAADREFIDSLIAEAKIAVTLSHGNIAQTYDLGKVGDDYFIVMEYVDGKSLSQISKRIKSMGKRVPLPLICYFMSEIANAIDYMHRRTDQQGNALHIVHRDISPQNVVVSYAGTVKLIDFGIAIAKSRIGITNSGILKGKFSYMSPEQARGDTLDQRSDIFSLGVIFHELLTNRRLFKSDDQRETLRNVRKADVPIPSSLVPDLPEELDRVVLTALAKDRRRRFASAAEMRDEILKFLHTAYPNFQPTDVAQFTQELFRDELASREEETSQTPHLIIEGTQSALKNEDPEPTNVHASPFDIREYLLEEDEEHSAIIRKRTLEENMDDDEDERTSLSLSSWKTRYGKKVSLLGGVIAFAALLFFAKSFFRTSANRTEEIPKTELSSTSPTTSPVIPRKETQSPSKEAQPPAPKVVLASTPSRATIFIDDAETTWKTPITIDSLPAGEHVIGLFVENYRFWKKRASLSPGETLYFDVTLTKDYGSLLITSQPTGALVIMNGIPVGETPLTRTELEPGEIYRIEIWSEGYEHTTKEIKVRSGRQEEIRVTLERKGSTS